MYTSLFIPIIYLTDFLLIYDISHLLFIIHHFIFIISYLFIYLFIIYYLIHHTSCFIFCVTYLVRKSSKKGTYAFDKLTSGRDDYDKKENGNGKTEGAELGAFQLLSSLL